MEQELTPFEKLEKAATDRMIMISAITAAEAFTKASESQFAFDESHEDVADQVIVKLAQVLEDHFGISA